MPVANPKPCRHPGCGALAGAGGYCPSHKPDFTPSVRQQTDPRYIRAREIRGSAQWRKVRAFVLAQHPLCRDPFGHHGDAFPTLAEDVHHIAALIDRPDLAFTETNLAPICQRCHALVEAMERQGKPTCQLFGAAPSDEAQAGGFGIA